MPVRLALLHSPFLTPEASWGGLPDALAALGHQVTLVRVEGDDPPRAVSAYAHSAAGQLPAGPVLLVAHSGAGPLVPVVAARRAYGGVLGAVLLDATLPGSDQDSRLAILRREDPAAAEALARSLYAGGLAPDWSGEDVPAAVLAGLRPRDLAFFTEPVPVPGAGWADLRWGYLRTSARYDASADRAAALGRPVVRREGGHFAALVDPAGVAADVAALAGRLLVEAPRWG